MLEIFLIIDGIIALLVILGDIGVAITVHKITKQRNLKKKSDVYNSNIISLVASLAVCIILAFIPILNIFLAIGLTLRSNNTINGILEDYE